MTMPEQNIRTKIVQYKLRKQRQKIERQYIKWFDTKELDEYQREVLNKYELMKYLIPKYPEMINAWHDCIMRCFELEGSDDIIINGEKLNREDEEEAYQETKKEIEAIYKLFGEKK